MPRAALRGIAGSLLLATGLSALAACGDTKDASMCDAYQRYVATLQPALAADPTGATAATATNAVEQVLASVQQLRDTADGLHSDELSRLETSLDDLRATLDSVDDTADYATWAPLVADTMQDVVDATVTVNELIDPECAPGS
jgi:hypothetical protein